MQQGLLYQVHRIRAYDTIEFLLPIATFYYVHETIFLALFFCLLLVCLCGVGVSAFDVFIPVA